MIEFWNLHKRAIIYAAIVITVVLILRFLTKKFLEKNQRQ